MSVSLVSLVVAVVVVVNVVESQFEPTERWQDRLVDGRTDTVSYRKTFSEQSAEKC